uniref:Uncharacterized protein n=1 Tax=Anguilla anguilla TaxID=7936 RepID=A0A0E9RQ30_ANGAN
MYMKISPPVKPIATTMSFVQNGPLQHAVFLSLLDLLGRSVD